MDIVAALMLKDKNAEDRDAERMNRLFENPVAIPLHLWVCFA
jgi:hypothetical protein